MQDRYKELWERLSEKDCSLETLARMIDGIYEEANQSFRYTDCCRSLESERNSLLAWRCPNWYKKRKIDELEREFQREKERFLCKYAVLRYLELTGKL